MGELSGKVAIVTGASQGIGQGIAVAFGEAGAAVVCAARNVEKLRETCASVEAAGGKAIAVGCDVRKLEDIEACVARAVEAFGGVDIVVNNAGILRDRAFHNLTPDELDPVLDVHLRGSFFVTVPAWRVMQERGYGRVVFTSSASGILGNFGQANYGAAKMGVVGMTRVLAVEGARHGIRVNAIAPMARTRMTDGLLGDMHDRLDPELVSPVAAWLAHERCSVTGEVFTVGGGRVGRMFVGVTPGYFKPDLTIEDVDAHLDEIRDEAGYVVPADSLGELPLLATHFA
jgi:NAD(P)-dependent dehydrogenase (short-subunit alcohol dehydrogenase family)